MYIRAYIHEKSFTAVIHTALGVYKLSPTLKKYRNIMATKMIHFIPLFNLSVFLPMF